VSCLRSHVFLVVELIWEPDIKISFHFKTIIFYANCTFQLKNAYLKNSFDVINSSNQLQWEFAVSLLDYLLHVVHQCTESQQTEPTFTMALFCARQDFKCFIFIALIHIKSCEVCRYSEYLYHQWKTLQDCIYTHTLSLFLSLSHTYTHTCTQPYK
jgi:hypothetical protein